MYVWVDDVAELAALLGITVEAAPWAREIDVVDPDGNRLRIGTSTTVRDTDGQLGAGTVEMLVAGTGDLSLVAGAGWHTARRCGDARTGRGAWRSTRGRRRGDRVQLSENGGYLSVTKRNA